MRRIQVRRSRWLFDGGSVHDRRWIGLRDSGNAGRQRHVRVKTHGDSVGIGNSTKSSRWERRFGNGAINIRGVALDRDDAMITIDAIDDGVIHTIHMDDGHGIDAKADGDSGGSG